MPEATDRPLTLAELEQWLAFGGTWRPVLIGDGKAVIELCECTGERVERRESRDPAVIGYLRARVPPSA